VRAFPCVGTHTSAHKHTNTHTHTGPNGVQTLNVYIVCVFVLILRTADGYIYTQDFGHSNECAHYVINKHLFYFYFLFKKCVHYTQDQMVEIAVSLAPTNISRNKEEKGGEEGEREMMGGEAGAKLRDLRGGLRQTMLASPLCDTKGFTAHLEEAFRDMWREYCFS
jgi:hypothetical protein